MLLFTRLSRTCAGVSDGFADSASAAAPATCGDAIEVPLMVLVAEFPPIQAEVMLLPGAKMSTQLPKFEKDERASFWVVEPTVIASGVRAGEPLHALALSLPAARA